MIRKDYVRLARALSLALVDANSVAEREGVKRAFRRIAEALAGDNPRFDLDRFHRAVFGDAVLNEDAKDTHAA